MLKCTHYANDSSLIDIGMRGIFKKLPYIIVFEGLVLLLNGCGVMHDRQQTSAFQEHSRNYGKLIRWGDFSEAAKYHRSRQGSIEPIDLVSLKDIRVTSYNTVRHGLSPDNAMATVDITLEYYNERETQLRSIQQQRWWYEEVSGRWFLESKFPEFTE